MEVFLSEICVVCLDAEPTCYIKPCGHLCYCSKCMTSAVTRGNLECPLCRESVKSFHNFKGMTSTIDSATQAVVLTMRDTVDNLYDSTPYVCVDDSRMLYRRLSPYRLSSVARELLQKDDMPYDEMFHNVVNS